MEVTITITMTAGQLTVNAPFAQRALCYGMLEMARDVIKMRSEMLEAKVVAPTAQDMTLVGG